MKVLLDNTQKEFSSLEELLKNIRENERNWDVLDILPEKEESYGLRITNVVEADDDCGYSIDYYQKDKPKVSFACFDDPASPNLTWAFSILTEFKRNQKETIEKYKWEEISDRVSFRNLAIVIVVLATLVFLFRFI